MHFRAANAIASENCVELTFKGEYDNEPACRSGQASGRTALEGCDRRIEQAALRWRRRSWETRVSLVLRKRGAKDNYCGLV